MCEFLVWRFIAGHCFLSYAVHLWRIDGAPGYCLAYGIRRISWELLQFRVNINKKSYRPVSRILSGGYHLSVRRSGSICLPSNVPSHQRRDEIGRAALNHWFMWHFSMQGLPACNVAITGRELLPHVFTLTSCLAFGETGRGYFLWHCLFRSA
jgi:hypothetical protein